MKLYARRRPAPIGRQSPPAQSALAEVLTDLDRLAATAASSPSAGAAVVVVADLADELLGDLADLAALARTERPKPPDIGPETLRGGEWAENLRAVLTAVDGPVSRFLAPRPPIGYARPVYREFTGDRRRGGRTPVAEPTATLDPEVEAKRVPAQRAIGRMRAALQSANRRLDTIAAKAAARERLVAKGIRLTTDKVVRAHP